MYQRLLEARGERERESAKGWEVECVRTVHETRARDAAGVALAGAGFRVVAGVLGERVQVASNDARSPIASKSFQRADSVCEAHLTQLRKRALLDAVVVRSELVVETTTARSLASAGAPAVADRLRRLDRIARLIKVAGAEVQQAPLLALVVEVVPIRPVKQRIDGEALVLNRAVPGQSEIRQRVAQNVQLADALTGLALKGSSDDRVTKLQWEVPGGIRRRQFRLPEVLGDA